MNRMENKLIIGQKQQLGLNQRLTQSIKILGLSYDEIIDIIKKEAEENPALSLDSEILNQIEYSNFKKSGGDRKTPEEELDFLDSVIEEKRGALDVIKDEIRYLALSQREVEIAKNLADNLDEAGFINRMDLPLISESLGCSQTELERILKELRKLSPAGLFAFNLKDSLLLQLRSLKNRKPIAEKILLSCLNYLLRGDFNSIALKLGVPVLEVEEAIQIIKSLNPRPLSLIQTKEDIHYVNCDLKVYYDEEGRVSIIMDDRLLSSIHFEPYYMKMLADKSSDEEGLSYIRGQFSRLKLMREAIEKRLVTLKRVAELIFERQRAYFFEKEGRLEVLTLKMIGESLNLHESTISRTLRNKYVDTPLGLFELRHFLQKGIKNGEDELVSKSRIKSLIRELIEAEDRAKPLSDKALMEALALSNIKVSRRVVCKYREEMGFSPSSKRKIKKTAHDNDNAS